MTESPVLPVLYALQNQAAYITINREKERNAITVDAITLFHAHLDRAEADDAVRAVLISGAGDKAFCTGAQLGGGLTATEQDAFKSFARLIKRIATFPKPTVARVNGFCLAGGMGIMLACDIAISSDNARFGTPEVNVGLWPMMIGALIFRNVPRKKAMPMILLGELFGAQEALDMDLISRVVPAGQLDERVEAVLRNLAGRSPIGIRIGKEAFHEASAMSLEEGLDYLSGRFFEIISTEDAREGITAFIEKRPPRFTGK